MKIKMIVQKYFYLKSIWHTVFFFYVCDCSKLIFWRSSTENLAIINTNKTKTNN